MTAQQYGFNWDATWLEQAVTPATPDTSKRKLFPKSDGFYEVDSTGAAHKFATSGGGAAFGLTSTATAAGTTTLTIASTPIQLFTGATTQNCVLPAATTLIVGWWYTIRNGSSGVVTVKDGGGSTLVALAANQEVTLYCSNVSSTAGAWSQQQVTGSGAFALATSPTLVTPTASKSLTIANATDATAAELILTAYVLAAATVSNKALTSNVATITTSGAHGLTTGQTALVASSDPIFNGVVVITGTPLTTTFTYAVTHADVVSAAATGSVTLVHTPLVTVTDPTGTVKAALNSRGHLALGTTTPSAVAVINTAETVADPSANVYGALINESVTLSADSALAPAVTGVQFAGILNQGANNATGAAPGAIRGLNAVAQVSGASGTVTAATAAVAQVQVIGGGTLTNGYGLEILNAFVSGSTLTSQAALTVPAFSAATNNTYILLGTATIPSGNWGVYVTSANPSSFGGSISIGQNATPGATLDLQGAASGIGVIVRLNATTPGNALRVQDSAGNVVTRVSSAGWAAFGTSSGPAAPVDARAFGASQGAGYFNSALDNGFEAHSGGAAGRGAVVGFSDSTTAHAGRFVGNASQAQDIIRIERGSGTIVAVFNSAGALGVGTPTATATVEALTTDAATNTVTNVAILNHTGGTGAAGFGTGLLLEGKDSATAGTAMARLRTLYTTITHASYATRSVLSGYDSTGERDAIGWGANGSAALLGFYPTVAAAPIAQPSAPTVALTTITFVAPGTPDYAIQTVQLAGYGFATADEGNTVLSVVANLQTRVNDLQTKLEALGLIA